MILLGLGANLPTPRHGPPEKGLEAALGALSRADLSVVRRSRWYRSAPLPASDQPWFVNGVAALETALPAPALLARLLEIEAGFGRRRHAPLAPRVLDLDLLDYRGSVVTLAENAAGPPLTLPHPRLVERAFVLVPLAEVAPDWVHPVSGATVHELIGALPGEQCVEAL